MIGQSPTLVSQELYHYKSPFGISVEAFCKDNCGAEDPNLASCERQAESIYENFIRLLLNYSPLGTTIVHHVDKDRFTLVNRFSLLIRLSNSTDCRSMKSNRDSSCLDVDRICKKFSTVAAIATDVFKVKALPCSSPSLNYFSYSGMHGPTIDPYLAPIPTSSIPNAALMQFSQGGTCLVLPTRDMRAVTEYTHELAVRQLNGTVESTAITMNDDKLCGTLMKDGKKKTIEYASIYEMAWDMMKPSLDPIFDLFLRRDPKGIVYSYCDAVPRGHIPVNLFMTPQTFPDTVSKGEWFITLDEVGEATITYGDSKNNACRIKVISKEGRLALENLESEAKNKMELDFESVEVYTKKGKVKVYSKGIKRIRAPESDAKEEGQVIKHPNHFHDTLEDLAKAHGDLLQKPLLNLFMVKQLSLRTYSG